jgi:hypothetical protein
MSNHNFLYSLPLDASHHGISSRAGSIALYADRCCEWLCRAGWLQVSFKFVLHTPGIAWLRAIFPFNYRRTLKRATFLMINLLTVDVCSLQLLCELRDGLEMQLWTHLSPVLVPQAFGWGQRWLTHTFCEYNMKFRVQGFVWKRWVLCSSGPGVCEHDWQMDSSQIEKRTFGSYWDDLYMWIYKPMGCICH